MAYLPRGAYICLIVGYRYKCYNMYANVEHLFVDVMFGDALASTMIGVFVEHSNIHKLRPFVHVLIDL